MKAAQISEFGGSEVVQVYNATKPNPGAGKVIVRVHAAGVNPFDWKIRQGHYQKTMPLRLPMTLGGDFSGVVEEVGSGVSNFRKGDEVFGTASVLGGGSGSFAEMALADSKTIAHKPKNVSHEEAAALPVAGISAWQALVETINLSKGQKILIHGGAGGIGTFAIQLAKHLGAHVATTVREKDKHFVKNLGADEVIDYENQSFDDILKDYDAVFDTVGGETYAKSFRVLKKGGIIVSMLEQPRQDLMKEHGVRAVAQFTQVNGERLSKLAELVDRHAIRVQIDKKFPLDKAGEALMYQQEGHPIGKVIISVRK